jgi:hypothetical protein
MRRRINLLLQIVEDSGGEGIEEKRLEEVLFANGVAEPSLTQKYLRYLIDFGKVVREGTTLYSPNVKTVQTNLEKVGLDGLKSDIHTSYTHEKGGSQGCGCSGLGGNLAAIPLPLCTTSPETSRPLGRNCRGNLGQQGRLCPNETRSRVDRNQRGADPTMRGILATGNFTKLYLVYVTMLAMGLVITAFLSVWAPCCLERWS